MCVYCFIADWAHEWVPGPYTPSTPPTYPVQPWTPWNPTPYVPQTPLPEWTREQYDQFVDILRRVKEMEEKLGGCPCEDASKMDFLKTVKDRLDALDSKVNDDLEQRRLETEACADPE
jgi:hypothetical protein